MTEKSCSTCKFEHPIRCARPSKTSCYNWESWEPTEIAELEARLRDTAEILIAEVGADGPMSAEDAARRAVGRIQTLVGRLYTLAALAPKEGTFEWALLQMRAGKKVRRTGWGICWHVENGNPYSSGVGWEPKVQWGNILATDWEVYEEPKPAPCPICKKAVRLLHAVATDGYWTIDCWDGHPNYVGDGAGCGYLPDIRRQTKLEAIEAHNERAAKIRAIMEEE